MIIIIGRIIRRLCFTLLICTTDFVRFNLNDTNETHSSYVNLFTQDTIQALQTICLVASPNKRPASLNTRSVQNYPELSQCACQPRLNPPKLLASRKIPAAQRLCKHCVSSTNNTPSSPYPPCLAPEIPRTDREPHISHTSRDILNYCRDKEAGSKSPPFIPPGKFPVTQSSGSLWRPV